MKKYKKNQINNQRLWMDSMTGSMTGHSKSFIICWHSSHTDTVLPNSQQKHHEAKPELYPVDVDALDAAHPVIHGDVPQPVCHLVGQDKAGVPDRGTQCCHFPDFLSDSPVDEHHHLLLHHPGHHIHLVPQELYQFKLTTVSRPEISKLVNIDV